MITAMKKILLLASAAILAAGAMQAKTADEVRIYLNPGHGSWGPNDRPMATIPYPNLPETLVVSMKLTPTFGRFWRWVLRSKRWALSTKTLCTLV